LSVTNWAVPKITLDLSVNMAAAGLGYAIKGDADISGSTFSGAFTLASGITPLTPASCMSGCSAGVNGFFAGNSAERAGLAYHILDDISANIVGAAAFKKQ
jgi:hypothetical protein